MMDKEKTIEQSLYENQIMLGHLCSDMRRLEEKIETILFTVCKSDDDKTRESINKYLASNFRNNFL